ncbi:MAG: hypothetical protein H7144_17960 [Burkholderiales bacterium]|nr:hypothetical protein [Phycisphaerae bacterium]
MPASRSLPALDRAAIEAELGFGVPDAFMKLLNLLKSGDGAVDCGADSLFHATTGLQSLLPHDMPPGTPPELFLIGSTGLDGINCGCVIHDPHLGQEYPLALYDPSAARADYLGLDFRRSLGTLMGIAWREVCRGTNVRSDDSHKHLMERVRAVIEGMRFDPDELPTEAPLGLRPRTPPGWRFAATADGLGVMAPATMFSLNQPFDDEPESFVRMEIDAYTDPARAAAKKNQHATALWHLRNGYTFWAADGLPKSLTDLMADTYHALGRHYLLTRLAQETALHGEA